jgi:hypothetical protein
MKVTTKPTERDYPYLAVWVGVDNHLSEKTIQNKRISEIFVISLLNNKEDSDIYVQSLIGGTKGFITKSEHEFQPLPKGFSITIEQ